MGNTKPTLTRYPYSTDTDETRHTKHETRNTKPTLTSKPVESLPSVVAGEDGKEVLCSGREVELMLAVVGSHPSVVAGVAGDDEAGVAGDD